MDVDIWRLPDKKWKSIRFHFQVTKKLEHQRHSIHFLSATCSRNFLANTKWQRHSAVTLKGQTSANVLIRLGNESDTSQIYFRWLGVFFVVPSDQKVVNDNKTEEVWEDFFKLFVLLADREGSLENKKVFIFLSRKLSVCCFFFSRVGYRKVGQPSELRKLHRLVISLIKTKLPAPGIFSHPLCSSEVLLRLFRGFIINEMKIVAKFVQKFNCLRPDYTFAFSTFRRSFT